MCPHQHRRSFSSLLFALLISILPNANAIAETTKPQKAQSAFVDIAKNKSRFDHAQLIHDFALSQFDGVFIEAPSVEFQKNWQRDHRTSTSNHYKERIKKEYAQLLMTEISQALTDKAVLAIKPNKEGTKTLIIKPKIIDLYINGPETVYPSKVFVTSAGWATLELQLINAQGVHIGTISDHGDTRDSPSSYPKRATRASNYYDFKRLMRDWSVKFAKLMLSQT